MKTEWAENEVNIYCKKAKANEDGHMAKVTEIGIRGVY